MIQPLSFVWTVYGNGWKGYCFIFNIYTNSEVASEMRILHFNAHATSLAISSVTLGNILPKLSKFTISDHWFISRCSVTILSPLWAGIMQLIGRLSIICIADPQSVVCQDNIAMKAVIGGFPLIVLLLWPNWQQITGSMPISEQTAHHKFTQNPHDAIAFNIVSVIATKVNKRISCTAAVSRMLNFKTAQTIQRDI